MFTHVNLRYLRQLDYPGQLWSSSRRVSPSSGIVTRLQPHAPPLLTTPMGFLASAQHFLTLRSADSDLPSWGHGATSASGSKHPTQPNVGTQTSCLTPGGRFI